MVLPKNMALPSPWNLFDRKGGNKVGVFPREILHIIEMVCSENLKINLDIGHAFIASNAYGLSLDDYFELGTWHKAIAKSPGIRAAGAQNWQRKSTIPKSCGGR